MARNLLKCAKMGECGSDWEPVNRFGLVSKFATKSIMPCDYGHRINQPSLPEFYNNSDGFDQK
jgi:hypothetical protein